MTKKKGKHKDFAIQQKLQIVILGASKVICTKKAYNFAYEIGRELALENCVVLTGGGMGVMEAALKGAKEVGGTTLAIIPWNDRKKVNAYADVVVDTGMGWSRDEINLLSCDGAIIVGGGAGTLNEATYAYMLKKPIVSLIGSGGTAEKVANQYIDLRRTEKIIGVRTAEEAVKKIVELIKRRKNQKNPIDLDKQLVTNKEHNAWKEILQE